ncbi:hypothetical protein ACIQC7_27990 [Kitasatospora sp. NPDC088556]|uniref:hypothetical protein n=1 Tax=Kitasatospora sp. NPDC088556 TaxID=3364076 RepID=UPI00380A9E03
MSTALGLGRQVTVGSLALDVTDDAGVTWLTTDLKGWRASPATTLAVTQRPADHGGWASPNPKLVPRQLELELLIGAPSASAADTAYEQLIAAVDVGPLTLTVTEGSLTRTVTCYRNGELLPQADGGSWTTYSVPLICPDPRRYGATRSATVYLPASTGGLSWPVGWPISWPATTVTGDAVLPGAGTCATSPAITIYGPTSGPALTTPLLVFTGPDGTISTLTYNDTIGAGDWLVIDCAARTVLYNGQATRRALLQVTGGWPVIAASGASLMTFRAATYDATSRAQVIYRPAWM